MGARHGRQFGPIFFDPDEFAFIKEHWVFLDHDQRFTGSAGIPTRGRLEGGNRWTLWQWIAPGFCQHSKTHPYETFNVHLSRRIQITEKTALKIRFDVVNLLDKVYELRDGNNNVAWFSSCL